VLVLLLPHVGWREFLPCDGQIGPVILEGLHWLQAGGILLYVKNHLLMSTICDVIPYQYLSHDSWPLCFLTPNLVLINTYLCSLVIFIRISTTEVIESCSFRSWFIYGLTLKTIMLGLDLLPLQMTYLYLPGSMPRTVGQTVTSLQLILLGCPATICLSDFPGTFPLAPYI
jgi:hypothetical protein